ncbi:MAG TPA: hypothetical protein VNU26_08200 [Mycobacteriales bacterium]|nr:hypothetical protein [Mycobacteriales bacterium]
MSLWVARLLVSDRTRQKISGRHGITEQEVRDAVELRPGVPYAWDVHPIRGTRAIASVVIRGRQALVVLYPADDPLGDVYWLGSVYFTNS